MKIPYFSDFKYVGKHVPLYQLINNTKIKDYGKNC